MILYDKIIIGITLGGALLLLVLAGVAKKWISNKWRMAYLVPTIAAMFVLAGEGFEISMLGAYIGILLMLIGFLKEDAKVRRICCISALILGLVTIPVCMWSPKYRSVDYVQDFQDGIASMQEHYLLTEHKGIDLESLYEEYLPLFQEANREQDAVANVIAWYRFAAEFRDGHVYFSTDDEETMKMAWERACGNDYGLSLMPLQSGQVVAVNVEPDSTLSRAGIQNGTVITAWDGRQITEVATESVAYQMHSYADQDNEAFWLPVFAAGVGGESVRITYLDDAGRECQLDLPKLGDYYERLKNTMEIVNQGVETGHMMWEEIEEQTVCLRIKMMAFDKKSSQSSDYSGMQEEIRAKVQEYKNAGKTNLILDLRDNCGGDGQMVMALASLFAPPGEHYYCTDGLWDDLAANYVKDEKTGRFIPGKEHYFQGENIWGDHIAILVNSNSVSAADHLTKIMQGMPNVTVLGFTEANGSAQGIGEVMLESGTFYFSNSLLLDKNKDIFIDSGTNRESGNDIDVRIPFDEEAVHALFDRGEDYILQYTLEHAW